MAYLFNLQRKQIIIGCVTKRKVKKTQEVTRQSRAWAHVLDLWVKLEYLSFFRIFDSKFWRFILVSWCRFVWFHFGQGKLVLDVTA